MIWLRFGGLNSSLGISASPVSAAGFPHNSDMAALFAPTRARPPKENGQINGPSEPSTIVSGLVSWHFRTGTSNVSSPHYLLRVVWQMAWVCKTPPIRTVTTYQVSGLPFCSRSWTAEVAMETLICSRSSSLLLLCYWCIKASLIHCSAQISFVFSFNQLLYRLGRVFCSLLRAERFNILRAHSEITLLTPLLTTHSAFTK